MGNDEGKSRKDINGSPVEFKGYPEKIARIVSTGSRRRLEIVWASPRRVRSQPAGSSENTLLPKPRSVGGLEAHRGAMGPENRNASISFVESSPRQCGKCIMQGTHPNPKVTQAGRRRSRHRHHSDPPGNPDRGPRQRAVRASRRH